MPDPLSVTDSVTLGDPPTTTDRYRPIRYTGLRHASVPAAFNNRPRWHECVIEIGSAVVSCSRRECDRLEAMRAVKREWFTDGCGTLFSELR